MVKQKHKFLLWARIKEPRTDDGIIKDLEREVELEVNWNDYEPSIGKIESQIVEFKKDGEIYKFNLEAKIEKGWFRDKIRGSSFGASGKLFEEQNFLMEHIGDKDHIVPLQTRTTGYFYLGGFLLLLTLGIGGYLFWKKKNKHSV